MLRPKVFLNTYCNDCLCVATFCCQNLNTECDSYSKWVSSRERERERVVLNAADTYTECGDYSGQIS